MKQQPSNRTPSKLITWIVLLSAALLVTACISEVADEADISEEEAVALSEAEGEGEDAVDEAEKAAEEAADEVEKAADDAADEAEKAVEEAADTFEAALRNFEALDEDTPQADVDHAFFEFNAASKELLAVAAAEGADVDALEEALDEMEQQIQSAMADGEPLQFQEGALQAQKDIVQAQLDALSH